MAARPRKLGLFAFLYFCEGAPIGLVWWALPAELGSRGMPIQSITMITASLALPWTLKFFWGPLIDRARTRFFSFPRWIALFQVGMALALLPVALSQTANVSLLWGCLLLHACFASAQDVATDAWAIGQSRESERGLLNGTMQAGMILGRWLFGAGLLIASSFIAFEHATLALALLLIVSAGWLFFYPRAELGEQAASPDLPLASFWRTLSGPRLRWAFLCALTAGLGYESFGAVASPFLLSAGYERAAIGWFFSASLLCMGAGSLLGGKTSDRVGHRLVYGVSVLLIFGGLASYWLSSLLFTPPPELAITVGLFTYLCIGVMISSSYAFFMDLSSQTRAPATSFSLVMAGTNACEASAAFGIGRIIPLLGYPLAFAAAGAVSLVSLLFLRRSQKVAPEPGA